MKATGLSGDAPERRAPRAAPLAPAARRAAIVEATLPLLRAHGLAISTRQIAEAACVAEGTIFSVFPDKEALLREVVDAALDPEPVRAQLRTIAADEPLERRLVVAVDVIQQHMAGVWELLSAPGLRAMLGNQGVKAKAPGSVVDLSGLVGVLEPHRDVLRREPAEVAQVLIGLILSGRHPAFAGDTPLPPEEIVSLLLDGVRV